MLRVGLRSRRTARRFREWTKLLWESDERRGHRKFRSELGREVDMDRFTRHTCDYYDLDWNRLPFDKVDAPNNSRDKPRPEGLDEMIEVARALSGGFCRSAWTSTACRS